MKSWNIYLSGIGLVKDIYKNYSIDIPVRSVIGHNRYSTAAKHESTDMGCLENSVKGSFNTAFFYDASLNFSMVHNGNIQGVIYEINDSEYIFNYIVKKMSEGFGYASIFL